MSIIINNLNRYSPTQSADGRTLPGLGNFRRRMGDRPGDNLSRTARGVAPEEDKPCPPTSTPDADDVFSGGEEVLDTVEYPDISFPEFLAPIEEINITQHQHLPNIREINIFDQNFFLRTNSNIFSIDVNGNEIVQVPGFHSQTDVVYKYPRIRDGFNYVENDVVEFFETGIDEFRINNNRFWCLNGTETNPIEERWANSSTRESLRNRSYNFTLEPLEISARSLRGIGYPVKKSRIIIQFPSTANSEELTGDTRLEVAQSLFGAAAENNFFEDFNTSIKQPLTEDEISRLEEPSLANGCYSIDLNPVIGNREERNSLVSEHLMPSLYREYFRLETQKDEDCDVDERIQKFLCSHIDHIDIANSTQVLRDRHQNYIEISLGRPKPLGNQIAATFPRLEAILDKFAVTELDKYLLEQITGFGQVYGQKQFIQITDEKVPQVDSRGLLPSSPRPNDQFSLGMLNVTKQDFTDLIHSFNNSEESRNNSVENVMVNARQYPLRFTDYNDRETLTLNDVDGMINFEDSLNNINSQISRTYDQILSGMKAPSYILGYIIEKYNSKDRDPIQIFMIMERPQDIEDTSNHQPIKFIDTQVKYGKSYRYRIYSISLVYGTEYIYDNVSDLKIPGQENAVDSEVQYSDFSKIVLAPFYQKVVSMSDLPPLPPEPTFVPYQGVSNKIRITLNHSVGNRKENPILVTPQDQSIISSMRSSQEETQDGKIHYLSDTIPTSYEIFMSPSRPRSYASFGRSRSAIVLQTEGKLTAIFETDIVPNLNYYFTFRSKELAGISNPSPVYRMKMVDTPNGIFMDLQEYDMYSTSTSYTKFSFQRALKISPALHQKSITYPDGTDLSSREFALSAPHLTEITPLGPDTKAIWDKKYKFRISSKSTCKKIDLNITFKQNTDERVPIFTKLEDNCDPILPGDPPQLRIEQTDPVDCFVLAPIPEFKGQFQGQSSTKRVPVACGETHITLRRSVAATIKYSLDFGNPYQIADPDTPNTITFEQWLLKLGELDNFVHKSGNAVQIQTGERTGPLGSRVTISADLQGKLKKLLSCPDDEDKIIDFLPPAVYKQQQRVDSGSDYRAVFDTNGDVPPHLEDDLIRLSERKVLLHNTGIGLGANQGFSRSREEMVTVEQKVYWTKAYTTQGRSPIGTTSNIQRAIEIINRTDDEGTRAIFSETEWKAGSFPREFTALNLIRSIISVFLSPPRNIDKFFPRGQSTSGLGEDLDTYFLNNAELSVSYGSRQDFEGIDLVETGQLFSVGIANIFIPAKLWPKKFFDAALAYYKSMLSPSSFREISTDELKRACNEIGDYTWNDDLGRCEKVCRDFKDEDGIEYTSVVDPNNPCACIDTEVEVTNDDPKEEEKEEEKEESQPTQFFCFKHSIGSDGAAIPANRQDPENPNRFLAQDKMCRYKGAIEIEHTTQCPGCTVGDQRLRMALNIKFLFEYQIDIISENNEPAQKQKLNDAINEFKIQMQNLIEQAEQTAGFGEDVMHNKGRDGEINISEQIRKARGIVCKPKKCPEGQRLDTKTCECVPVTNDTTIPDFPRMPELDRVVTRVQTCNNLSKPRYFIQAGIAGHFQQGSGTTRSDIVFGPEIELTENALMTYKSRARQMGRPDHAWIHFFMAGASSGWDSGSYKDRADFATLGDRTPDKAIQKGINVYYGLINYPTTVFASDDTNLQLHGRWNSRPLDTLPGERNPAPETVTQAELRQGELELAQREDDLVTGVNVGSGINSILGSTSLSPDLQIMISSDLENIAYDLENISDSSLEANIGLRDANGIDGIIVRQGLKFRDAFWLKDIRLFKEDIIILDQDRIEAVAQQGILGSTGLSTSGQDQARVVQTSAGDFSTESKNNDPIGVYTLKITRTGIIKDSAGISQRGKETDVVLVFPEARAPVKYVQAGFFQERGSQPAKPAVLKNFLNDTGTGTLDNGEGFDETVPIVGTNGETAPDLKFREKYGINSSANLSMYGIQESNLSARNILIPFAINHFVNFDVDVCND